MKECSVVLCRGNAKNTQLFSFPKHQPKSEKNMRETTKRRTGVKPKGVPTIFWKEQAGRVPCQEWERLKNYLEGSPRPGPHAVCVTILRPAIGRMFHTACRRCATGWPLALPSLLSAPLSQAAWGCILVRRVASHGDAGPGCHTHSPLLCLNLK